MENRPIIYFSCVSPAPGADNELLQRYRKWRDEVYRPIQMKIPEVLGVDRCLIARKNPEYPEYGSVSHYRDLSGWKAYLKSTDGAAIREDINSWMRRGIIESIWDATYSLLKSYRSKPNYSTDNQDTQIENASIMHLESYRMSEDDQEKYLIWFNDYGRIIFMPLFLKLPGFMGFDWYEYTGLSRTREAREIDYPKYISISYFENIESYEAFADSPELAGFQKSMRSVFPLGLNLKWYVQYQLTKSWRK